MCCTNGWRWLRGANFSEGVISALPPPARRQQIHNSMQEIRALVSVGGTISRWVLTVFSVKQPMEVAIVPETCL
jgi:hypothetical protein